MKIILLLKLLRQYSVQIPNILHPSWNYMLKISSFTIRSHVHTISIRPSIFMYIYLSSAATLPTSTAEKSNKPATAKVRKLNQIWKSFLLDHAFCPQPFSHTYSWASALLSRPNGPEVRRSWIRAVDFIFSRVRRTVKGLGWKKMKAGSRESYNISMQADKIVLKKDKVSEMTDCKYIRPTFTSRSESPRGKPSLDIICINVAAASLLSPPFTNLMLS